MQLRNAIGDTRYLWPHGVVHWTIDSHHSGRYWSYLKGQMRPIVHYFSILFSLQYEDFHTAISKLYFYAIWYFFRFENIVSIEIYDFIDNHSIAFCMLFKEKFKILKPQNSMVMHAKCLGINRHKWKWRRNNSSRKIDLNLKNVACVLMW